MKAMVPLLCAAALMLGCSDDSGTSKNSGTNDANNVNNANNANNSNQLPSGPICSDEVEYCATRDCSICRFEQEQIVERGSSPAIAMGTNLHVAFLGEDNLGGDVLQLATRERDEWRIETLIEVEEFEDESLRMAVGPDDALYLTYNTAFSAARFVYFDGSEWTAVEIPQVAGQVPVTVSDDGRPWVAKASFVDGTVTVSSFDDGAFTDREIGEFEGAITPAVDIASVGEKLLVAWRAGDERSLRLSTVTEDAVDTEQLDESTESTVFRQSLSVAGNEAGKVVVTFGESIFARASEGAIWVRQFNTVSEGIRNAALVTESGDAFVAAFEFYGVALMTHVPSPAVEGRAEDWPHQLISTECDNGSLDLVIDADGMPVITFGCSGEGLTLLKMTGEYPADYAQKCRSLTDELCAAALECNPDAGDFSSDLCLDFRGSNSCINVPYCEQSFYSQVCGDATQPAEVVDACSASDGMCFDDGDSGGIALPDECFEP